MLATWKMAPALAAGCTVVLKPAEWSPLSASLLADLAAEAGLAPGVLNVVQGIGEEAGAALVAHAGARRISLDRASSPEIGRLIARAAAANLVPFTAELGGKGPFLVFADDLDGQRRVRPRASMTTPARSALPGRACSWMRRSLTASSSSSTASSTRRSSETPRRRDDLAASYPPRPPGPRRRLRRAGTRPGRRDRPRWPALGARGALVRADADRPALERERDRAARGVRPVLTFQRFVGEAQAIDFANSTRYGLSAILYTGSKARADRVGRALRAGTVWVNTFLVRDLTAPFGGIGVSGIGREGGDYALDFYSDLETLQILDGTTA